MIEKKFEKVMEKLFNISFKIHNICNSLEGYSFADERGYLKVDEQVMISKLEKELKYNKKLAGRYEKLILKYECENWEIFFTKVINYLKEILLLLQNDEKKKDDFNILIIPDLLKTLTELKNNIDGKYSKYWAMSAGNKVLNENGIYLFSS